MKRRNNNDYDIKKKNIKYEEKSIGDLIDILKESMADSDGIVFNDTIKVLNTKFNVVNYCIDNDDDFLLSFVVNMWSGFRESFKENKVLWSKRIIDCKAHRCYGFFKVHLSCNFLPECYYDTSRFNIYM